MLRGNGLSMCMAWHWLYKLGWQHIKLKKRIYMDGHKRPDIIEYYINVFLPLMALLEKGWCNGS
jgi:hypothetical protein